MIERIYLLLGKFMLGHISQMDAAEKILSLLGENTGSVSDAPPPSGVYTQVRERDESGQDSNALKASVTVPLGNMIDSENICPNCDGKGVIPMKNDLEADCWECDGEGLI